MAENILMNEGGILITTSKFMISGKIYRISEIKAVKTKSARPVLGPLALIALGLVALTGRTFGAFLRGSVAAFFLVFLLIAGGALWWVRGIRFTVVLITEGGDVTALRDRDSGRVIRVVKALNKAIMAKGRSSPKPGTADGP